MKADRWRLVEKIFNGALELEGHEQSSFVDRECASDASLKAEVEALLRSHRDAGSFLGPAAVTLTGHTFGTYEVKDQIGSGGMGDVYRAWDTKLKRNVAMKVLPQDVSSDAERISRFRREAEILASLNHPHIAAIYDLVEFEDSRFLVLELVEGE